MTTFLELQKQKEILKKSKAQFAANEGQQIVPYENLSEVRAAYFEKKFTNNVILEKKFVQPNSDLIEEKNFEDAFISTVKEITFLTNDKSSAFVESTLVNLQKKFDLQLVFFQNNPTFIKSNISILHSHVLTSTRDNLDFYSFLKIFSIEILTILNDVFGSFDCSLDNSEVALIFASFILGIKGLLILFFPSYSLDLFSVNYIFDRLRLSINKIILETKLIKLKKIKKSFSKN